MRDVLPVKPTFFLQLRHLFFFFFPSLFPSGESVDGDDVDGDSSRAEETTAVPAHSDSFLCKKRDPELVVRRETERRLKDLPFQSGSRREL